MERGHPVRKRASTLDAVWLLLGPVRALRSGGQDVRVPTFVGGREEVNPVLLVQAQ